MKRTTPELEIDSNRLFAAADAILRASESARGLEARVSMAVGPRFVGETLPANVFTSEELIEAMAMLTRMGLAPSGGNVHGMG